MPPTPSVDSPLIAARRRIITLPAQEAAETEPKPRVRPAPPATRLQAVKPTTPRAAEQWTLGGTAALIVFWFAATLAFNYVSCQFVAFASTRVPGAAGASRIASAPITPEDITLIEMGLCGLLGGLALVHRGRRLLPPRDRYLDFLACSAANLLACRLFMISLSRINISLVQSVRASQPVFVVALRLVFEGKRYAASTIACVLIISLGFSLAALGDVDFDTVGFACACASVTTLCGLNLMVKRLSLAKNAAAAPEPLQLQFWVTAGSFLMLLPLWSAGSGPARVAALVGADDVNGGRLLRVALLDGLTYYLANVGTFSAVSKCSPLSYAVTDTVRRLLVVCSGFVYQGNPCSFLNAGGVVLVFFGVAVYNWLHR
jgi:drug/metabolite transporter (DMT)-like permease